MSHTVLPRPQAAARCFVLNLIPVFLLLVTLLMAVPAHAQVFSEENIQRALGGNTGPAAASSSRAGAQITTGAADAAGVAGPVQLRSGSSGVPSTVRLGSAQDPVTADRLLAPAPVSEFTRYVRELVRAKNDGMADAKGQRPIAPLGSDLVLSADDAGVGPAQDSAVPPDYRIKVGDTLALTIWGSVEADLRLEVDRAGRVSVPRVGTIAVAGVPYAKLASVIRQRVGTVFRNFDLSVTLGNIQGIRVFVTGYAERPGSYVVSGFSTLSQVLFAAGGPSASGSFRNIQLKRGNRVVSRFDLYDLLARGDRSGDVSLQSNDVIFVGSVGPQVALIGSVNRPAILEIQPGETVRDALQMAGGFAPSADTSRLTLQRIADRNTGLYTPLRMPQDASLRLSQGDVLQAYSAVEVRPSLDRQNKRVLLEGEVLRPGQYVLPANATLADAVQMAGGLTPGAYLYGTQFVRESVRKDQQQSYAQAVQDFEVEMRRNIVTQRVDTGDQATAQTGQMQALTTLVQRLQEVKPSGRLVLQLQPGSGDVGQLPAMLVEDGDRLYIPARPSSVGVFGSVISAGNFLADQPRPLSYFLAQAGGPTPGADSKGVFVLRANGQVVSARQVATGFFGGNSFGSTMVNPGDTIFMPEEANKTYFLRNAKDWTQIISQFGLGAAAIKALGF
ncbi:SLBB domain-containing protein [Amphibiibacter pelophylacis]|uniref:SLBB domain-containing protein n=1 Tax=Amphibiibacter pelophylacis TaxID=1799477 RepID=A0ACC6P330_9BURK